METNLKDRWKSLCDEYAIAFANKHGYDIQYEVEHNYLWIGKDPGSICEICDMFIGMEEMRYDVDNDIPEDKFEKWYWKSVDVYEITGKKWLNYESYCKGAPDYYSDEKLEEIKKARKKVEETKQELQKLIDDIK